MNYLFGKIVFLCLLTLSTNIINTKKAISVDLISECFTKVQAVNLNTSICNGKFDKEFYKKIKFISIKNYEQALNLSTNLRKLGYFDQVLEILNNLDNNNSSVKLALANLYRSKFLQAKSSFLNSDQSEYKNNAIREQIKNSKLAINIYCELYNKNWDKNSIIAGLNWMLLISELDSNIPELEQLKNLNQPKIGQLIEGLDAGISKLNEPLKTNARLTLAKIIVEHIQLYGSFLGIAEKNTNGNVESTSNNLYNLSNELGLKASLLELQGNTNEAKNLYIKALNISNTINQPELSYLWHYKLAKIYKSLLNRTVAIDEFSKAITDLENIRESSLSLKPEIQYEFRDRIEPIYRDYLAYLFQEDKPDFNKIIKLNESLQIGELENYLQCGNLGLSSILDLTKQNSPDATIYIIKLPNQYSIILKKKDGSIYNHFIERKYLDSVISRIKLSIEGSHIKDANEIILKNLFQKLNDLVFESIDKLLPPQGTLLFALDSNLQNIPFSLVYNGNQYLFEKYSIAYALGTRSTNPKPLGSFKGLVAGSDNANNEFGFQALPNVDAEVRSIQHILNGAVVILNKSFTTNSLLDAGKDANIIHIATHGQFSSNPNDTFILAWNSKIPLHTIEQLIHGRVGHPLELLVLSACSTAEGDNRASLGIAGTAMQSGARSTVASLWTVDDASQVELMRSFYLALKLGHSKADALRIAQLNLLHSTHFHNPYYFGGIILVGSWL